MREMWPGGSAATSESYTTISWARNARASRTIDSATAQTVSGLRPGSTIVAGRARARAAGRGGGAEADAAGCVGDIRESTPSF